MRANIAASAVEKAVSTFGRLDVLVNNAGTAIPKPFEEQTHKSGFEGQSTRSNVVLKTTETADWTAMVPISIG